MKYILNGVTIGEARSQASDPSTNTFLSAFMTSLQNVLSGIVDEPFYLCWSEYENGESEPSYTIVVASDHGIEEAISRLDPQPKGIEVEGTRTFETSAEQYYSAINLLKPSDSYCGHVKVRLAMFADLDVDDVTSIPNLQAENLIAIVFFNYYRLIHQHYASWQTHYIDGPEIKHVPLCELKR